ncbi:hypothetical protein FKM82_002512 [Ascaphus truei]
MNPSGIETKEKKNHTQKSGLQFPAKSLARNHPSTIGTIAPEIADLRPLFYIPSGGTICTKPIMQPAILMLILIKIRFCFYN